VYKSAAIPPTILMHLMIAKQAETCCAVDVLNKEMQRETTESLKS
jgi:hypothetical protein